MARNGGYVVETYDGKRGRTFHSKGLIKEKIPVYIETEKYKYSETAILYSPDKVKIIGYID